MERMQALKFTRRLMEVDAQLMPASIVQSLVAIAEQATDEFRRVCLDTIRDLGMLLCFP